ncbi:MAG: type II toxin-antitoxin system HipA family toxin [Candidatus Cryptobacteroides sp.]|nr:type II toxin-antitoxin system HipA family toxin [Bacteroides sp.]MDY5891743.1 type II toxin-antitoxin system HipA family toxin [Candidatus Cryptobacteroides sp.]
MIPQVNKITVFHNRDLVGTLQMTPDGRSCAFEYSREWLSSGFALSPFELPLTSDMIFSEPDKFDRGFAVFEDSIPDGYGLYLIDRMLRKSGFQLRNLNPLQRLAIVGSSGMGALRYEPAVSLDSIKAGVSIEELDDIQRKALEILSEKGEGDESLLYYNSANSGGARPKVVMADLDGSHWLVKFRHTYDSAEIGKEEYLYMSTAAKCGINIPRIRLLKDRYFAIERFDIEDGRGVHVVTAAALLKSDFRNQGADYTNLLALTGYLTQDPHQVEEMYRRMVFNLVCDNKDDHTKNFSFICRKGVWSLAPAYDITYSPEGSNGQHATSLFYDGNPAKDLVIKAGTRIRIPKATCEAIIDKVETVCSENLPLVIRLK